MSYITKWCDEIQSRTSMTVSSSIAVTGVRDAHLGPRLEYAKIEVLAEPATTLEVAFAPDVEQSDTDRMFLDAAVFGVLDILLVSELYPLRNVAITLTRVEYDPISSSPMAFRQAGRDAGRKIMGALKREGGA